MADPLIVGLATTVIAAVVGVLLERLRLVRGDEAHSRQCATATRRALRLVERELYEAETRIARSASAGEYAHADSRLAVDAWHAYQGDLAAALGIADWHRVTAAYDAITNLNETLEERIGAGASTGAENAARAVSFAVDDVHLRGVNASDELEFRWRAIRAASWILRAYSGEAERAEHAIVEDEQEAARLWPRRSTATA